MALLFTLKDVVEVFSFLAIVIHAFKYKEKHIIHTGFPWLKLNKMWRFNKFTFLLSCLLNKHIQKAKRKYNNDNIHDGSVKSSYMQNKCPFA